MNEPLYFACLQSAATLIAAEGVGDDFTATTEKRVVDAARRIYEEVVTDLGSLNYDIEHGKMMDVDADDEKAPARDPVDAERERLRGDILAGMVITDYGGVLFRRMMTDLNTSSPSCGMDTDYATEFTIGAAWLFNLVVNRGPVRTWPALRIDAQAFAMINRARRYRDHFVDGARWAYAYLTKQEESTLD